MKNKTDYFITVAIFNFAHELTIIRSRLEAEGIECRTLDELTVQVNPLYSPAVGGIKLQVKESDAQEAIEILKENGHVTDHDFENQISPGILAFDKYTSKIPILKHLRYEIRLIILVTIIVGIASAIFHFANLPSNSEI